ncbi:baseplate J/gp47 family protein [Methylobacterium sp. E-005]|uniref:baseplate J/gp47 family protein n=1 Tax=Methylobacterium sp. E-005 TaxID=2836549 RepID=UPI001FBA3C3B|nr:baseplate J/gp47 family protein [Methylobacterium sp. E-005]MCJ2084588.1 baseplate J/gp47 family protein [Methylobacterium sp. E-005]
MTVLDTRSQSTIVGTIAAGIQSRLTSVFLNFAKGKVLRALAETYAGNGLWLQKENLQIAMLTRLATSYGSDIDTFIADFPLSGVTRLGAQAATGLCTFSRYTAGPTIAYVPVGGTVRTTDGSQTFQVYADATNPAYVATYVNTDGSLGAYAIAAQVNSVTAPVIGATAGSSGQPGSNGNVGASTIGLISSTMPGVDTVTNPAAFTNGFDVESDASVMARFALAVAGRGGGTIAAIQSAVANLKVGMTSVVLPNSDINGNFTPGVVSVIVDDGSGNISAALLAAAQTAVYSVIAEGIRPGIYAAALLPINVVMQITTAAGYVHQNVVAQVSAALALYLNGLGQGATVGYFELSTVACNVSGVAGIVPTSYTLNGGTSDITGTAQNTPKANNLVIS